MTQDWAREKVEKYHVTWQAKEIAARLLRAERARARRIVRAQIATIRAEIRAIDDGHYAGLVEPAYEVSTLEREISICDDILQRLG